MMVIEIELVKTYTIFEAPFPSISSYCNLKKK